MKNNYAFKGYKNDSMARVSGRSLPISFKTSIEICSFLRKRKVSNAKEILQRVLKEEQAIPFKRFNSDVGHKPGKMAGGRYPFKASKEILTLLDSVEANAQFKGLNTANLVISSIIPNKAATTRRFGRQRSRSAKRTNIEIVVTEVAPSKKEEVKVKKASAEKTPAQKPAQKADVKEAKPAVQKEQPKVESKPAEKKAEAPAPKAEEKKAQTPATPEAKKEEAKKE